jgi:hypothetical protein
MSCKTDQIDGVILNQLPDKKCDAVGIMDLCQFGGRIGTIRASLKRLIESGSAKRQWDGNQRYGRFVYWAA